MRPHTTVELLGYTFDIYPNEQGNFDIYSRGEVPQEAWDAFAQWMEDSMHALLLGFSSKACASPAATERLRHPEQALPSASRELPPSSPATREAAPPDVDEQP